LTGIVTSEPFRMGQTASEEGEVAAQASLQQ
jgi:hypothetical protein